MTEPTDGLASNENGRLRWWFWPSILGALTVSCASMALYHAHIWDAGARRPAMPPSPAVEPTPTPLPPPNFGTHVVERDVADDFRSRLLALMDGNYPVEYHGGEEDWPEIAASQAGQARARRWCEERVSVTGEISQQEAREIVASAMRGNREASVQVLDAIEGSQNERSRMQCAVLLYGAAFPVE